VCDTESVFIHVTVVPAVTFTVAGLNARSPSVDAPVGIVTDDDDGAGVGAGGGVGDGIGDGAVEGEEVPPQAPASMRTVDRTAIRDDNIESSAMKWVTGVARFEARLLSLQ
jgi:hypothetical protein